MVELPVGFRLAAHTVDVGTFAVSDLLVVADPGYVFSSIRDDIEDVVPGCWHAYVDVSDPIPGWGKLGRESELRAISETVINSSTLAWESFTNIPVDSGQVSIGNAKDIEIEDITNTRMNHTSSRTALSFVVAGLATEATRFSSPKKRAES